MLTDFSRSAKWSYPEPLMQEGVDGFFRREIRGGLGGNGTWGPCCALASVNKRTGMKRYFNKDCMRSFRIDRCG